MTDYDPFGLDTPKPKAKEATVSEETDNTNGISITHKGGVGYDAPWIVFHASDPRQALQWYGVDASKATDKQAFDKLIEVSAAASNAFATAFAGGKPAQPAPVASAPAAQAPVQARPHLTVAGKVEGAADENVTEPPAWMGEAPPCPHGQSGHKKFVTKVGKFGRWYAWGCAGPQGGPTCGDLDFRKQGKR